MATSPQQQVNNWWAKCSVHNWDSYGADPVTPYAVDAALDMTLTPTNKGGAQVSWKGEEVTVEFDRFGHIVAVAWDRSL